MQIPNKFNFKGKYPIPLKPYICFSVVTLTLRVEWETVVTNKKCLVCVTTPDTSAI